MSEHQLITPRRNFLIRALGFTAAGATVSIPVLLADSPQKRVNHHIQELTKALREMYPGAPLIGEVQDFEAWHGVCDYTKHKTLGEGTTLVNTAGVADSLGVRCVKLTQPRFVSGGGI